MFGEPFACRQQWLKDSWGVSFGKCLHLELKLAKGKKKSLNSSLLRTHFERVSTVNKLN